MPPGEQIAGANTGWERQNVQERGDKPRARAEGAWRDQHENHTPVAGKTGLKGTWEVSVQPHTQ